MAEFGRVLFMRHPQTEFNNTGRLSGRIDVGLSEHGREQACRAAAALVAWRPDRIITSPLARCHAIADAAARELGIEPIEDERVIEIDFGEAEGIVKDHLADMGLAFPWDIVDGHSVAAPRAETFEALIERARGFVDYVATLRGKTVVVTHGGFSRAVFAAVYREPIELFWDRVIPNVSSQVFVSNGARLALQTAGLTPEELRRRADAGYVPHDSVSAAAECIELDDLSDN